MRSETFKSLVSKPVHDFYGRALGKIIGIYVDNLGQLKSVGVDEGHGNLKEYSSTNIVFEEGSLVIVPKWRVEIEKFKKENAIAQKRSKALDELLDDGEIDREVYDNLGKQYNIQSDNFKQSYDDLSDSLKTRLDELDSRQSQLNTFIANIKIQHKTGEIDSDTYDTTIDHITSMQKSDESERNDILGVIKSVEANVQSTPEDSDMTADSTESPNMNADSTESPNMNADSDMTADSTESPNMNEDSNENKSMEEPVVKTSDVVESSDDPDQHNNQEQISNY